MSKYPQDATYSPYELMLAYQERERIAKEQQEKEGKEVPQDPQDPQANYPDGDLRDTG